MFKINLNQEDFSKIIFNKTIFNETLGFINLQFVYTKKNQEEWVKQEFRWESARSKTDGYSSSLIDILNDGVSYEASKLLKDGYSLRIE